MNQTEQQLLLHAATIETKLKYTFKDRSLLILAFIHRSYTNEHKEILECNERLEFLGDSVLGMLVAEYLYRQFQGTAEGELSYLRSRIVEACSCYHYIQVLGVSHYILLGKGERLNDGRGRDSILADLFEAIIGAIYLDGGFEAAKKFLFDNFSEEINQIIKTPLRNWKALLQDYCQKTFQTGPEYKVMSESGPDHNKIFEISVYANKEFLGSGQGSSKKEAQQAAAEEALSRLNFRS